MKAIDFIGFNDKLLTIKTEIDTVFKDAFVFQSIYSKNNSGVDFLFDMIKDHQCEFKNEKEKRNFDAFMEGLKGKKIGV